MPRHSIKSRKLIQSLFMNGRKFQEGNLSVYADKAVPDIPDRYAAVYVVPSVSGNAPQRNRIKRWLREDFSKLQKERPANGAFIIRFKGEAGRVAHDAITGQLEKIHKSILIDG